MIKTGILNYRCKIPCHLDDYTTPGEVFVNTTHEIQAYNITECHIQINGSTTTCDSWVYDKSFVYCYNNIEGRTTVQSFRHSVIKKHSWRGFLDTTNCVSDLRQVRSFLRKLSFPPTIKLTTTT
jgi:hypothetical protein